ncbi:DNA damage-inducible protein 1 [Basidiobolus ranarum]|uniref:DNA damage-inducible protein 1 n=1 Tax=Basidiobolus ranarum TaxID=34480 RepID=A0ABR2VQA6_9FUNG
MLNLLVSPDCAQACGLMRLLDTRFAGIAKGVGTAKILGRVHSAQLKVGSDLFLQCSFTVMEGKGVDLLFGLDMLRRHQACIDLRNNSLIINDREIPFLAEHELPKDFGEDETVTETKSTGPSIPGTNISGLSAPLPNVTASGPSSSQPSSTQQTKYSEESIQIITNLGISREEAIAALDAANGNPDVAASMLFS